MLADIQRALDARMAAFGGEIAWEGVPYAPTKGVPYLATSIAGRLAQTSGIGPAAPRFWSGVYQVLVAHPLGEGLAPAYDTAARVLAQFPRGLTLISGPAKVVIERGSAAPAYDTADWINVPVQLAWYCEELPE